jgi:hypothetical protein
VTPLAEPSIHSGWHEQTCRRPGPSIQPASWSVTVSAYWRASASAGGTRRRRTRLLKEDPSTAPGARALSAALPYSDQDRRSSRCRIIDGFSPNMSVLMS